MICYLKTLRTLSSLLPRDRWYSMEIHLHLDPGQRPPEGPFWLQGQKKEDRKPWKLSRCLGPFPWSVPSTAAYIRLHQLCPATLSFLQRLTVNPSTLSGSTLHNGPSTLSLPSIHRNQSTPAVPWCNMWPKDITRCNEIKSLSHGQPFLSSFFSKTNNRIWGNEKTRKNLSHLIHCTVRIHCTEYSWNFSLSVCKCVRVGEVTA